MPKTEVRFHDQELAQEYVELNAKGIFDVAQLQKHLMTAQAKIRVLSAELAAREQQGDE